MVYRPFYICQSFIYICQSCSVQSMLVIDRRRLILALCQTDELKRLVWYYTWIFSCCYDIKTIQVPCKYSPLYIRNESLWLSVSTIYTFISLLLVIIIHCHCNLTSKFRRNTGLLGLDCEVCQFSTAGLDLTCNVVISFPHEYSIRTACLDLSCNVAVSVPHEYSFFTAGFHFQLNNLQL